MIIFFININFRKLSASDNRYYKYLIYLDIDCTQICKAFVNLFVIF
jgi:hypothetical protein